MKKVTQSATARRILLPSVQNAFDLGIVEAGARLCSAAWLKRRRRAGVRIICRAIFFFRNSASLFRRRTERQATDRSRDPRRLPNRLAG